MSQTGEFDSSQAGGGFPGAGEGNRGLRARGSVSLGMKTFRGGRWERLQNSKYRERPWLVLWNGGELCVNGVSQTSGGGSDTCSLEITNSAQARGKSVVQSPKLKGC